MRTILAIAALKYCPIFKRNVHNTFLNDNLDKEVYMTLTQEFGSPGGGGGGKNVAYILFKFIYGLKHAFSNGT